MSEHERTRKSGNDDPHQGTVTSVRGSVVDALFPDKLPALHNLLHTGDDGRIVIEVITHLNSEMIRGIALVPTQGLAYGSSVIDTGNSLRVPVGKRLLGRVFNVFGETIDKKEPINGGEWRSIHQEPVPLSQQSTVSEIFETGIKAVDVLAPL